MRGLGRPLGGVKAVEAQYLVPARGVLGQVSHAMAKDSHGSVSSTPTAELGLDRPIARVLPLSLPSPTQPAQSHAAHLEGREVALTLHPNCLRHTYASLLLQAGDPSDMCNDS
jgi:hypothetical protein